MAITTITNSMVSVNAIQGTLIADNAITAVHIASNAVASIQIAENNVTAREIASNSITVAQLADDSVEADKIADGVITTNHLNKAMISSQTEVTPVAGDFVLLGDTSDSNNLKKSPLTLLLNSNVDLSTKLNLSGGTMTGDLTLTSGTSNKPKLTITNTNADASSAHLILKKDSASPADNDEVGRIYMYGDDDAGNATEAFLAIGKMTDVSNGSEDSSLDMYTYAAGAQKATLSLKEGNVGIGTASPNSYSGYTALTINGTSGGLLDFETNGTFVGEVYANGTTGLAIQAIGSRTLVLRTNGGDRMTIDGGGAVTIGGTLGVTGVLTANSGITFGDGHSIGNDGDDNLAIASSANENIIIDSADDIILDADGGDIKFKDGGSQFGGFNSSTSSLKMDGVINSGSVSNVGIGTSFADANGAELGPGYLTIGRDDTATAKQLLFSKNGSTHSYLETSTSGLNIGGANVGIGTASPTGILHVDGHTSSVASIFESNGNGDTVPVQLKVKANNGTTSTQGLYGNAGSASTGNTITLGTNGTTGLTIDNLGNLKSSQTGGHVQIDNGVGVTVRETMAAMSHTWQANTYNVLSAGAVSIGSDSSNTAHMWWNTYDTGSKYNVSTGYGADMYLAKATGDFVIRMGSTNAASNGAAQLLTEAFKLDKDGHAKFSQTVRVAASNNYGYVKGGTEALILGGASASESDQATIILREGGNNSSWNTQNTERMRILTDGEVVFNSAIADTYSPLVNGITADALVINRHSTSGSLGMWRTNTMEWKVYHNGQGYIMTWGSNGVISGDFNDTSDVNLKENISTISDGTTVIKGLRPVKFDWKASGKGNNQHGFIAQEVETVLPDAVEGNDYVENETGLPEDEPAGNGKNMNSNAVLAHAVKAIQELEARIATLEG